MKCLPVLPIEIWLKIGRHLNVIEREALNLPPRKLSQERLKAFEEKWSWRFKPFLRITRSGDLETCALLFHNSSNNGWIELAIDWATNSQIVYAFSEDNFLTKIWESEND